MPPKKVPPPAQIFKPGRRASSTTQAEKDLVAQFVRDQPGEIRPGQVTQLSKLMRRTPECIKKLIQEARDQFAESAKDYVDIHLQATAGALADGDYETATKASAWAMTNLAAEGVRVIDRASEGDKQPRVMIGIKLGGLETDTRPQVRIEAVEDPLADPRG